MCWYVRVRARVMVRVRVRVRARVRARVRGRVRAGLCARAEQVDHIARSRAKALEGRRVRLGV